jgi:acyl carrier protein
MGLDTVELVMEIEDEFAITLPDADAELIQTAGQLHAYVCHRLRPQPAPRCASARAFYFLRRVVLCHHDVSRSAVRPGARVAQLLPADGPDRWSEIADALRLRPHFSFNGKAVLRLPAVFTTVRDLIRMMTFPNAMDVPARFGEFEAGIWRRVRAIISKQVGVGIDEIHMHTHFINDLGME